MQRSERFILDSDGVHHLDQDGSNFQRDLASIIWSHGAETRLEDGTVRRMIDLPSLCEHLADRVERRALEALNPGFLRRGGRKAGIVFEAGEIERLQRFAATKESINAAADCLGVKRHILRRVLDREPISYKNAQVFDRAVKKHLSLPSHK